MTERSDHELRACGQKCRYATMAEARQVVKRMRKQGNAGMGVYRCIYCGCVHVGHRKKKNTALGSHDNGRHRP